MCLPEEPSYLLMGIEAYLLPGDAIFGNQLITLPRFRLEHMTCTVVGRDVVGLAEK